MNTLLRERAGVHFRSVEKNTPRVPVAERLNTAAHNFSDLLVRRLQLCTGVRVLSFQVVAVCKHA